MMKKESGPGTTSSNGTVIGRRMILKSSALVVGAGTAMSSLTAAENAPKAKASYGVDHASVIARAGTAVVEIESGKIADAWIQFARTGDPNHKGIPNWPKFTLKTVPTMMFDNEVKVELNPDALELESIA